MDTYQLEVDISTMYVLLNRIATALETLASTVRPAQNIVSENSGKRAAERVAPYVMAGHPQVDPR